MIYHKQLATVAPINLAFAGDDFTWAACAPLMSGRLSAGTSGSELCSQASCKSGGQQL